ncbi:MAG: glycerol-3-phosphate dehydrogenase/oxidase [Bacteroidetes bacterium]|nr:glycerol-3-phosphate dehydrogenase/oxidase [Bacteroidota bacterium]
MAFSNSQRESYVKTLSNEVFDILVIGGGITGAGIALDAAARGLKVALVEKNDFGSGTSSRSTKLIHGGLRYLKQLEVKIVREVGIERAIVYNNAPHIVIPEKMLLPIVRGGSLGKYSSSLGLFVYDRLAKVRLKERRKMLSVEKTHKREPLLRRDILLGGGVYIEYRSDDARLVIETMKSATERGAVCINYSKFTHFIHNNDRVSGGTVEDLLTGEEYTIRAKTVINACGPWVDEIRKKEGSLNGKYLMLTKGVHIVIPKEKLPLKASVYFDVPTDNRMVFAIPRGKVVYIGTTDTVYNEDMEHPFTSYSDAEYLLEASNYMFPDAELTMDDVESSWAGLRPLIHEEGKDPSEVSRKDEIFLTDSKLISIAGGKLTGYRKMAERSVDVAMKQLDKLEGREFVKCSTKKIALSGGSLKGNSGVKKYADKLLAKYKDLSPESIKDLVFRYGDEAETILKAHKKDKAKRDLIYAELDYCLDAEMIAGVGDFLVRRTGMLFFERPALKKIYRDIHQYISNYMGYSEETGARLLEEFEKEYFGVVGFKSK